MGEPLTTLSNYFITRIEEASGPGGDRDSLSSDLQCVKEELSSSRKDSCSRVDAYERAYLDRDRCRRDRDTLPSGRVTSACEGGAPPASPGLVLRDSVCDPYAQPGYTTPPLNGSGVVISSFEELREVPRHPSCCAPDPYGPGSPRVLPKANPRAHDSAVRR